MSVFASPSKTTVDMDEINKVLWPVYVRAALRGATISRCEVVGTVQKREWLKLLRGGGLDGAQATLVYYAETAKHERCFTYSAFKPLCLRVLRHGPDLETKVLRRHGAREDVDRMQQSLTFAGWAGFAATFAFADRLGPDAVSAIFVDSAAAEARTSSAG
ncbi:hypothetical protein JL722_14728 [Aureococcus anophagefferens]|nr:hypothetical protein JL722_14728 [Aureococcus anophagefferens]